MIKAEAAWVAAIFAMAIGVLGGYALGRNDGFRDGVYEGRQQATDQRQPMPPAPCKFKHMSRRYCELNCQRESSL